MKLRFNLSIKITMLVVVVSILSMSFIYYIGIQEEIKFLKKINLDKALYLSTSLDASISDPEELNNREKLSNIILKHLHLNPDILTININLPVDKGLIIAASSDDNLIGNPSSPENLESYNKDIIINKPLRIDGKEASKVITAIHMDGRRRGTIEITLSQESANKAVEIQNKKFIEIALVTFILLVLLLLMFLERIVIVPINELSKGMEKIREGNLGFKVKISSNDDIGDLGRDFNNMSKDLDKYKKRADMREEELEKKVKERTKELSDMKEKYRNLAHSMSKAWLRSSKAEKKWSRDMEDMKKKYSHLAQSMSKVWLRTRTEVTKTKTKKPTTKKKAKKKNVSKK